MDHQTNHIYKGREYHVLDAMTKDGGKIILYGEGEEWKSDFFHKYPYTFEEALKRVEQQNPEFAEYLRSLPVESREDFLEVHPDNEKIWVHTGRVPGAYDITSDHDWEHYIEMSRFEEEHRQEVSEKWGDKHRSDVNERIGNMVEEAFSKTYRIEMASTEENIEDILKGKENSKYEIEDMYVDSTEATEWYGKIQRTNLHVLVHNKEYDSLYYDVDICIGYNGNEELSRVNVWDAEPGKMPDAYSRNIDTYWDEDKYSATSISKIFNLISSRYVELTDSEGKEIFPDINEQKPIDKDKLETGRYIILDECGTCPTDVFEPSIIDKHTLIKDKETGKLYDIGVREPLFGYGPEESLGEDNRELSIKETTQDIWTAEKFNGLDIKECTYLIEEHYKGIENHYIYGDNAAEQEDKIAEIRQKVDETILAKEDDENLIANNEMEAESPLSPSNGDNGYLSFDEVEADAKAAVEADMEAVSKSKAHPISSKDDHDYDDQGY